MYKKNLEKNTPLSGRSLSRIFTFLGFIFYPLYFTPLLFWHILKGERWPYILFTLFIGALAYLIIPIEGMDIIGYYDAFDTLKNLSFKEIFDYSDDVTRYFTFSVIWLLEVIGFSKEMIPFTFVIATYLILLRVFFYVIDDYKVKFLNTPKKIFILIFWVILFFEVGFMSSASGLRNQLSFSISLLGLYLILSKNYTFKGLGLLLVAALIHPSAILFIFLYFLIKGLSYSGLYRILLYLSILALLTDASAVIMQYILSLVNHLYDVVNSTRKSSLSISGAWGGGYWDLISYNSFVYSKYVQPLPFYVALIYLFFTRAKSESREYRNFLYALFFVVAVFSFLNTLFVRYNTFSVLFFTIMLMIEYRTQPFSYFKKVFIIIFVISIITANAAAMYKYRYVFESWIDILYLPMPVIIVTKEELDSSHYRLNL